MSDRPSASEQPYADLTPDAVLDAVDGAGYRTDGRLHALASYENRVYQVGIEEGPPLIVKFYRPERWSDAQILEEHRFLFELAEHELPCVPPLRDSNGESLLHRGTFRLALFPRQGGHAPNLESDADLEVLGRTLARLHAVGQRAEFEHRPALSIERLGTDSRTYLLTHGFIPDELRAAYQTTTEHVLARMESSTVLRSDGRIHGDCHPGNVLWRDDAPHFVDFDDAVNGPVVQDLWMLLSGPREEAERQLGSLLAGYEQFLEFDTRQLLLIEALRTLRIMHHAAWIARRWNDPAFPRAFPWFGTMKYWSEHVLHLREQLAALDQPPLRA